MCTLTREGIAELLSTNDKAVGRALLVIHANQTVHEQRTKQNLEHNGVGFNSFDADVGTDMALFFKRNGYLSPKQLAVWRKTDKNGNMRIAKYWKQLVVAANARMQSQIAA